MGARFCRPEIERITSRRPPAPPRNVDCAHTPSAPQPEPDKPKPEPEDLNVNKYFTFDAPNLLLKDRCVGLVRATFLLKYVGPIDARQTLETLPDSLFHGPLELGDVIERGLRIEEHVVIAVSYTWTPLPPFYGQPGNEDGTKDHPDPRKHYLGIVQRVLALMLKCWPYGEELPHINAKMLAKGYTEEWSQYAGNKRDKTFLFWVRPQPAVDPAINPRHLSEVRARA